MSLISIVLATLLAGVGSVWLAALITTSALARHTAHLLSLAAGALLATAFMNLLPEAFESQAGAQSLFVTLLVGLIFFFLLDKAELYHHGHEHHHDHPDDSAGHDHGHAHSHEHGHGGGGWPVLLGDGVHAFGDGALIAAAFVADVRLGVASAMAVLAHEIPHHVSDLVVLQQNASAKRAIWLASFAGLSAVLGGVLGYFVIDAVRQVLPYMLTLAASSFIYVALADLIPQLQKRLTARQTLAQIGWLGAGLILIGCVSVLVRHQH